MLLPLAESPLPLLLLLLACDVLSEVAERQWPSDYWRTSAKSELNRALSFELNANVAKNLIFVVGDGMGVSTVTGARILKGQREGGNGEDASLSWETFPHVALSKTYNTNQQTPDSAGTATAYHCGFKTKSGVIGLDDTVSLGSCSQQLSAPKYPCMLRWAEVAGKSTGIVTTTRVTHASPSPLYAYAAHRDWESDADLPARDAGQCKDIAAQLIESGGDIEVIMGGGRQAFYPNSAADPEYRFKSGKRKDRRNLIEEWKVKQAKKGRRCTYVWRGAEFKNLSRLEDCVLALFEPSHMLYEDQRRASNESEPSLTEMVTKAIEILNKNSNGFYLFIEGGRIDHGHHSSLARYALEEAVELSRAVMAARSLTSVDDTLVVVTADHSHVFTIGGYAARGNPILGLSRPPGGRGAAMDGMPMTSILYGNGPGYGVRGRQNLTGVRIDSHGYVYQSAVPLQQETHGAEDVAIYASGPMSHLFHGVQEQSYIPHAMAYAACIGADSSHCSGFLGCCC